MAECYRSAIIVLICREFPTKLRLVGCHKKNRREMSETECYPCNQASLPGRQ